MRSSLVLALVLGVVSCRSKESQESGPSAATGASTALGASTAATPSDANRIPDAVIAITKTQILVSDDSTPAVLLGSREDLVKAGIDAKYKRNGPDDRYIVPLANTLLKLQGQRQAGRADKAPPALAAIVADPSTPYRVFMEVLFTLSETGFSKYQLLVVRRAGSGDDSGMDNRSQTPWRAGAPPAPGAPPSRPLALSVTIADAGVTFATSEGPVGPGCAGKEAGVTVPKVREAQDLAGVAACAKRLKSSRPQYQEESTVTLMASPGTEYGTVIAVVNVLRGPESELFPELQFQLLP